MPLSAFARIERRPAPLAITHQGLFPATTLSFNLADGVSLGAGGRRAARAPNSAIGMPDAVTTNLVGAAAEFATSLANEKWLLLAAIVTVYIVLGMLYESFIHPITILSTLPSAGVGALLALMLCGEDLDLISLIGIILLIGIVKKNAIMMVDFALDAERDERHAAVRRDPPGLHPALPPDHDDDHGGLVRRAAAGGRRRHRLRTAPPLGIAIVGGLIVSQVLTLYTTPVIYLAFAWLQRRLAADAIQRPAARRRAGGSDVNLAAPFIRRPVATHAADGRRPAARRRRLCATADRVAAGGRPADHRGLAPLARRQPGHGRDRAGAAARTPTRHHPRHRRNGLV